MTVAIEAKELTKSFRVHQRQAGFVPTLKAFFRRHYQKVEAVKKISFKIEEGEMVGFLGPNGAGKTTTLKMISGLLYPTLGQVRTLGFIPQEREHRFLRLITLVVGNRSQLWWEIPVEDSLRLNQAIYDLDERTYQKRLKELTELLEIAEILRTPSKKLSLGQRMKAELAAALLHEPKLLLLDEPTLGLDVVMQKKIRQFLLEYNKRHQATILLTSHNMEDVAELCQRVILIDHGSLIYDGSLKKLISFYAPMKRISLDFSASVGLEALKEFGLSVSNGNEFAYWVETPRDQVSLLAARLINNSGTKLPLILDMSIEEPPIKEVIRMIFTDPSSSRLTSLS